MSLLSIPETISEAAHLWNVQGYLCSCSALTLGAGLLTLPWLRLVLPILGGHTWSSRKRGCGVKYVWDGEYVYDLRPTVEAQVRQTCVQLYELKLLLFLILNFPICM